VAVVDADGRLDPRAPERVAGFFADPEVGGLQVLVRIYNRHHPLTWCQDVEFSVYGLLYQPGRTPWGTAGMGGNGQFQRLQALDSIVDTEAGGPWRDKLTEDQDLGLRLLGAGWRCVSSTRATVDQQGLPSPRRLLRQRTRWAQGNLQAMSHLDLVWRAKLPFLVRLDLLAYLMQPITQAIVGITFVLSILFWVFDIADFWGSHAWIQLLFFFLLGYGGVLLGCVARGARRGPPGVLVGLLITPVYAAYSWIIWPVLARATARQLTGRTGWAKTARQPIGHPRA
jgi:cellulose synthase/poly-beta-1,6-N-acetylglucosamine synthase-like glycosyltransferase